MCGWQLPWRQTVEMRVFPTKTHFGVPWLLIGTYRRCEWVGTWLGSCCHVWVTTALRDRYRAPAFWSTVLLDIFATSSAVIR